jgi:ABC-type uncharacterized transport system involved in gliding motility auxiliary subunit
MSNKGPVSFPDLARAFDEHVRSDHDSFEGMKKAFTKVEEKGNTLDQKQDQQIDVLHKLLEQANASATERGRRIEREAREKKFYRWMRWVIVPLAVLLGHLVTKYWLK